MLFYWQLCPELKREFATAAMRYLLDEGVSLSSPLAFTSFIDLMNNDITEFLDFLFPDDEEDLDC